VAKGEGHRNSCCRWKGALQQQWQRVKVIASAAAGKEGVDAASALEGKMKKKGGDENGQGINQDYEEAKRYYKLAADQGNALAQYNLALIYEVIQNYSDAIHYYKLAAEQGDTDALSNLERIKI
jgi:tetratricopeptide (TPR) repeat protein